MPVLMVENFDVYSVARRALLTSRDSMSGRIDANGIHRTLVASGVEPGNPLYSDYFVMSLYYVATYANVQADKSNKGGHAKMADVISPSSTKRKRKP